MHNSTTYHLFSTPSQVSAHHHVPLYTFLHSPSSSASNNHHPFLLNPSISPTRPLPTSTAVHSVPMRTPNISHSVVHTLWFFTSTPLLMTSSLPEYLPTLLDAYGKAPYTAVPTLNTTSSIMP